MLFNEIHQPLSNKKKTVLNSIVCAPAHKSFLIIFLSLKIIRRVWVGKLPHRYPVDAGCSCAPLKLNAASVCWQLLKRWSAGQWLVAPAERCSTSGCSGWVLCRHCAGVRVIGCLVSVFLGTDFGFFFQMCLCIALKFIKYKKCSKLNRKKNAVFPFKVQTCSLNPFIIIILLFQL